MNKSLPTLAAAAAAAAALTACAALVNAAPGADQVRITSKPADVVGCQAVGNVDGGRTGGTDLMLANVVVGLGGDTLLMTLPAAFLGVAYRCAKG